MLKQIPEGNGITGKVRQSCQNRSASKMTYTFKKKCSFTAGILQGGDALAEKEASRMLL